jgi:hypothetical protein
LLANWAPTILRRLLWETRTSIWCKLSGVIHRNWLKPDGSTCACFAGFFTISSFVSVVGTSSKAPVLRWILLHRRRMALATARWSNFGHFAPHLF